MQIPQVQIPDFAGTIQRAEQAQASRLQALMAQQQMADDQAQNAALRDIGPALAGNDPAARIAAYGRLVASGPRGAQIGLPLLQRERGDQEFQTALGTPPPRMTQQAVPPDATAATPPPDLVPLIEEASRETGIPVPVLTAVIRQESNFNPAATGRAGEVGLMQVMPATARQPGYGVPGAEPEALRDPRSNVLFGARYLAGRGRAAGVTDWNDPQQVALALRAYNGGGDPNYVQNVNRWMPPGEQRGARPVDNIPGAPAPEVFARMAQLAAGGNEGAQRFVQTWGPFMRQNEQNPPPTIRLGDGPHGRAGVYQRNRDGSMARIGDLPPPETQVTVAPGETAFERERGKSLAERVTEWEGAEARATSTTSRLQRFEAFNRVFTTGAGANLALSAGQVAQRLGLSNSVLAGLGISADQTASGEALRSLTSQLLVGMLGSGGFPTNNFSDADRAMLERSLPNIANTPQGNTLIAGILRASAERDKEIGAAWRSWSRTNSEGRDSVMRFQQERLPAIINRDILAPVLADAAPADEGPGTTGPGGRGVATPPPSGSGWSVRPMR